MTAFLGKELANYLNGIGKRYAVVYETTCETNIPNIGVELLEHTQEEAVTLIIHDSDDE